MDSSIVSNCLTSGVVSVFKFDISVRANYIH